MLSHIRFSSNILKWIHYTYFSKKDHIPKWLSSFEINIQDIDICWYIKVMNHWLIKFHNQVCILRQRRHPLKSRSWVVASFLEKMKTLNKLLRRYLPEYVEVSVEKESILWKSIRTQMINVYIVISILVNSHTQITIQDFYNAH